MLKDNRKIISQNLEKILNSASFQNSKRNRLLLGFLVEETLTGRANRIKEYTIGVSVFEDVNFELGKSSVVRNQMVRLRKALNDYYLTEGKDDEIKIVVEKGQYVPRFLDKAKELNEPGLQMKLIPLLAVLPFRSYFPEQNRQEMTEYLTDELILKFTAFSDLRVIANYSILTYFKQGGKMTELSSAFGLDYLIEGKVQITNNILKINVQLINAENGVCSWAKKYQEAYMEYGLTFSMDIIINEIAQSIAGGLGIITQIEQGRLKKSHIKKGKTELYKAIILSRNADMFPETYFTKETFDYLAMAIDDYHLDGELHARYAFLLSNSYALNLAIVENPWEKAKYHMEKAMALDPANQFVMSTKLDFYRLNKEYDKIRPAALRVISLNPNNAYLVVASGWTLAICGYLEDGIKIVEKSLRNCPIKPYYVQYLYFLRAYTALDFTLALKEAYEFHAPGIFWKPLIELLALEKLNFIEEASTKFNEIIEMNPDFASNYSFYLSNYVYDSGILKEMEKSIHKVQIFQSLH
ncbi:hypothetical protein [Lentimicrobium sp. S6]|uniref:hypothetical protein n=1 Tax=Lentimicrobium sp. S6 TaxID=2735872 RepID=UPI0015525326|nr:hypothetical protein [Lentimicrobium sp. S6]NPD48134.1 hypothetical protein [Lentimicrobium sp. S6]